MTTPEQQASFELLRKAGVKITILPVIVTRNRPQLSHWMFQVERRAHLWTKQQRHVP